MPAETNLLTVESLAVSATLPYGDTKMLVADVNLSLNAGRAMAIVGESGSGKTTLAKALAGLLPSSMTTRGKVTTVGLVGYMFQDAGNALNPTRRVIWQVEEALRALGVPRQKRHDTALDYLKRAEVPDVERHAHRYPHQLSGGLAQRVLLAAVLAASPSVLIADEPTSALDVTTQARIATLLRRLVREEDLGMLLITHDLTVAAQIADDIAVMYQGRLVEQGSVDEVLHHPQHDYTRELIGALPNRGQHRRQEEEAL
ncbi:ABC transporter ATP-binding protein [Amycolatopsis sp. CA-161197]|uniref:ABC transporter ATP-binding protein n=1 Tax=Amycolatopsis sp. CA-161197 TaxID=3239922 RepID=UPI003D8C0989